MCFWVVHYQPQKHARLQDRSVRQEGCEELRNPSDRDIQAHVEKAAGLLADLEEEVPLLPTRAPGNSSIGVLGGSGAKRQQQQHPTTSAQPKRKGASANKTANPLVEAATARARTAKDFAEISKLLARASSTAHDLLEKQALAIHGSKDEVREDMSLDLLRSRLKLVNLALDESTGQEGKQKAKELFSATQEDPYLKDLATTTLADPECCQTLGVMKSSRLALDLFLVRVRICMNLFLFFFSSARPG